jgi:formamidopyrimidine-DNA glycosylase
MPELPEVETMCRCIASAAGCRIRDVTRPKSRLQSILIAPRIDHFRCQVVGRKIEAVRRLGKRVVLVLDAEAREERGGGRGEGHNSDPARLSSLISHPSYVSNRPHPSPLPAGEGTCGSPVPVGEGICAIVLEPRMTGLVLLAGPPDQEHVRLVFRLSGGTARRIIFWDRRGLGVARLVTAADPIFHGQLGPDALGLTQEILQERLGDSRRAIKVALLDQHALAGIGNLYASEILHRARIHPAVPCHRLRPADWLRLHAAMGEILAAAIHHQGSTLRDGTYRIAHNRSGDYQIYHRAYSRAGEECLQCGADRIVRIVQAQRSTFYCPSCQRPCSSRPRG